MAADLHIHVLEGATEKDVAVFNSNTLGSKHCKIFAGRAEYDKLMKAREKAGDAIDKTPNIWVGEVSWLKAGLTGDEEAFIPDVVAKVSEIIGEDLPVIDEELITKIARAFAKCKKHKYYESSNGVDVIEFLNAHCGKKAFTISW